MSDEDEENRYLSDIIFQRSTRDRLRFEMAVGPILTTLVVLSNPTGDLRAFILASPILLSFVAFARWLTYTDRFANDELFIEKTVRLVEVFALVSVVQLYVFFSDWVSPHLSIEGSTILPTLSPIGLTALIVLVGTVLYILLFQLIFNTYRLGWGALYYVKFTGLKTEIETPDLDDIEAVTEFIFRGESFREWLGTSSRLLLIAVLRATYGRTAFFLLKDAIPEERSNESDEDLDVLREYVEINRNNDSSRQRRPIALVFIFSAAVVIPVFLAIAWLISLVFSTFSTILLSLVTMRLTKHIVGFTYIAFGTLRFDQFITTNLRSIGLMTGYTVIVYLLFFRAF